MEVHLLYGILLAGSPAFGLEALFLGVGGISSSIYGEKIRLLAASLPLGLTLVAISIGLTQVLSLSPSYLCVLPLGLSYLAGKIISNIKTKEIPKQKEVAIKGGTSNSEIKNMLKRRGLEGLIKDNKKED